MPLTDKGEKIKDAMEDKYGKEKGEQVFYASKNKGTVKGVDAQPGLVTVPSSAPMPRGRPTKSTSFAWTGRKV